MAILKINSNDIKNPLTITVDIADLDSDNAGRNQLGQIVRDRVAIKAKVSCTWGGLTSAQLSTLLSAVEDTSFTLEYPDPRTGSNSTGTFYVGDRSSPIYKVDGAGNITWQGLSMNFVEV